MSSYKLKPITEASWILYKNNDRLAMIIKSDSGYKIIGDIGIKTFTTVDELSKLLGNKVIIEDDDALAENEVSSVLGYPIKHKVATDIKDGTYPNYAKSTNSDSRFAAGYYGVLFNVGWVPSYCPKTSTLDNNTWIGPFKSKLEMNSAIIAKKKEIII